MPVFALFSRKSTLDATASAEDNQHTRLPTPTPSINSVTRHSPFRFTAVLRSALGGSSTDLTLKDSDQVTDSVAEGGNSSAPPPPATPSPPPAMATNDTKILYDRMLTLPPKTLHAYTLAHLRPDAPFPHSIVSSPALGSLFDNTLRPPSPDTVTKLTAFFSALAPPPLLHCVRCHKDFYDIENEEKDKACRVAHDDESALVSRVSEASGGSYETLWGCCGQTASGDGSEGPPDGWCYEGRHTTDVKRARFRADSTMHNDKLASCFKLNCRGIRDQLPQASPSRTVVATTSARKPNPSPARSQASTLITRTSRKRPRKSLKESGSENEADSESLAGRAAKAKEKEKERVSGGAAERNEEGTSMAIDNPSPPSKSKPKSKSQPVHRARSTPSTPMSGSTKAKATATRPKVISHTLATLLSQSRSRITSDSEASTRPRPRTRSNVREESRGRTTRLTRANMSERAGRAKKATKQLSTSEGEVEASEDQESDWEERGRDRKKRRLQN